MEELRNREREILHRGSRLQHSLLVTENAITDNSREFQTIVLTRRRRKGLRQTRHFLQRERRRLREELRNTSRELRRIRRQIRRRSEIQGQYPNSEIVSEASEEN